MHKTESKFNWIYFILKPFGFFFRFIFLGFGGILIISLIGGGIWLGNRYNSIGSVKDRILTPPQGSVVYDRNGIEMFKYVDAGTIRDVVGIDKIPEQMQLAVIALEDENFYYNEDGIPWKNLAGSLYKCVISKGGDGCRGGSGLSQQLVKNVTNQRDNTFDRKINELISAYKFGQEVDKKEVLRLYLNWVSFGRNTFGVQEASKSYFGHSIDEKDEKGNYKLTIPKACFLAGMLPQPETFATAVKDKLDGKETDLWKELEARKNSCIDKQAEKELRGFGTGLTIVDVVEAKKLKEEKVEFKKFVGAEQKFGHIKAFLTEEFKKLDVSEQDLFSRGLRIKTTFDLKIQSQMEDSIKKGVTNYIKPKDGNNAAGVVLDGPTGQIVAMVGSVDFNNKEINGEVNVATAPRQPGSSIKPYVYASAFSNGFNPATVLLDSSIDFGAYKPLNFDKKFYGAVAMKWALQNSLNIPAVKALYLSSKPTEKPDGENGLSNFFNFTNKTGVEFPLKEKGMCGIGTSIGGCEVTLLSHANGINTLLQSGNYLPATPFLEIKETVIDKEQDLYQLAIKSEKNPFAKVEAAIDPGVANQVARVMSDTSLRVPGIWGTTSQYLKLDDWTGENAVASKTGTTNDVKDMWVVGGSPYYTVVVWAGNTDSTPMDQDASSSGAVGPIWKDIMKFLHKDKEKKGFSKDGLTPTKINPADGLLSENGTPELLTKKQIEKLTEAKDAKKLALASGNQDKNASIFVTRTPILYNQVKVNSVDGFLADEKSDIPEDLIKTISCTLSASEFPAASNWKQAGSGVYTKNLCPFSYSSMKKIDLKVTLAPFLSDGNKAPEVFNVKVNTPGNSIRVKNIQIKIDGQLVALSNDIDSLGYAPQGQFSGKKTVIVVVKSDLSEDTFEFKDVEFSPTTSSSKSNESKTSSPSNTVTVTQ
jgi:membrane peptidoglycan carboxypeptidase